MKNKIVVTVAVVVALILGIVIGSNEKVSDVVVGAIGTNPIENYVPAILYNEGYYSNLPVQTTSSVTAASTVIGTSGSTISLQKAGTCSLIAVTSIAATSTGYGYCTGITGVQTGDIVTASLAASTTLASQFVIKSVQASTTPGAIDFSLVNLTGTARVPASVNGFGSSTQFQVIRSTN